jgi:hypothetical protein
MTLERQLLYVAAAVFGIVFLPYAGAWIVYAGSFPKDYFDFPATVAAQKYGFNRTLFILVALFMLVVALFYAVPRLFGFKSPPAARPPADAAPRAWPVWFWIGLAAWAVAFVMFAGKFREPRWLLNWALIPLWWGFTLVLDGWLYRRTGGRSLLAAQPRHLIGIAMASISGWLLFEYLNAFVLDTWIYPRSLQLVDEEEFMVYAFIGSSALMAMLFEWNALLNSFTGFARRYADGPRIRLPRWLKVGLLVFSLAGLFLTPFFPDAMFGILWVAPLFTLAVVLDLCGLWTPFTSIGRGNWTPLVTICTAFLIEGVCLEGWNYASGTHDVAGNLVTTYNPAYWTYSLPYVDVLKIFEMPVLGYCGYLPYGAYCGIWWIVYSFLLGIPAHYGEAEVKRPAGT